MIAITVALALFADPTVGAPSLTRAALTAQPTPAVSMAPTPPPVLQSVAVTLECTAFADGRVGDCKVLEETHPGMGFGEAAIALMRDATTDRSPADHQFARTIQFMP
ncbi:hypothetical protein [Brevundimonas sp. NIBR11]|uniref:hypothetical protein n=1 Tax=Brevundimonas sp. NIBR11 TaxID=3015999 RepID=UPI0022F08574|nr:hypothetical protein [Brevundimonas sp. NIBR11]WGM29844.1 hypothetical protein KKHFBJBL_00053 [Brevundimonas sp. NIBR11]